MDDLVNAWKDEESDTSRSYPKFKIHDRKNDVNVETSCGPEFISNYFQKSELPWEISPAFFRPEAFGTLRAHVTQLVTDCDKAFTEILRRLKVNLKS